MVSEKEKMDQAQKAVSKRHNVLTAISRGWPGLNFQKAWDLWNQAEEALGYSDHEEAINFSFDATRMANRIVFEYTNSHFKENEGLFNNDTGREIRSRLRDLEKDLKNGYNLRLVGMACQQIVSRIDNEISGLSQRAEQIGIEKEALEQVLKNLQQQVAGFSQTKREPLEALLGMAGKAIAQFPSHGQETKKFVAALEKFISENKSFFCS